MVRNWFRIDDEYRRLVLLGGVFFLLLVCVSVVLLYASITGLITGGTASLGASLLLVLLTGGYAFITLWMTHETRRSRQQEIQPVLEFLPKETDSTVINLGNGPARNIDLTLTLEPKGESHPVQWQSLAPQQELAISNEPLSSIADREYTSLQVQGADVDLETVEDDEAFWEELGDHPYDELHMEGTCEDVWGNSKEVDETYDVWNLTQAMVGTVPSTMDEESSLELVAVELSRLRRLIEEDAETSDMYDFYRSERNDPEHSEEN